MDYVDFEAEVEYVNDSNEEFMFSENLIDDKLIDDSIQEENDQPSFYRFVNQTQDPDQALNDDNKSKLDVHDLQPKVFYDIKRVFVEFDEFDGYQKYADKFKETLCSFQGDLKNFFFNAIL